MEDEVMEQIRTRLAAATSAATALAKSLDALDENTLQTLEFWLAKQDGDSKCGKCRARTRGKEASVCIACGSKRPPLPSTRAYDFKVSFAFLQFLETIHPPLKSGSRKIWNPIVSIASGSPEPLASTADLPVEREVVGTSIADIPVERDVAETSVADIPVEREVAETSIEDMPVEHEVAVAIELVHHFKEDGVIDENVYRSNFQESPSVDNNGKIAGEDGVEADDFGDFQESWGESAVEPRHEISEEVVELNGYSHSDQFRTDLEAAKVEKEPEAVFAGAANSGAANTWDTEWDYSPSHFISARTQSEKMVPSDNMLENSKDITVAAPQVLEYDLSIFESFGGIESKEENVLPDTDANATFWDFQNKNIVNSRLASVKAMERFASDTSAFTTITDADSDSGDSSLEALPPPKLPLDILMELGASSGQNDLLGSLTSHDLDDFQKVPASSHPLATLPTSQDPFSWPLETLDTMSSQVSRGDVQNVENSSAATLETSGHVALDPFPWPLEEFDSGLTTVAHSGDVQNVENSTAATLETSGQIALDPFPWPLEEFDSGITTVAHSKIQQDSVDLMDLGRPQSEGNRVDPFSWPLDTFTQSMPGVEKVDANGPVSASQAQVNNAAEEESEDWGDEEFVWSQAEPANESQFTSTVDLLPSSPLSTSFTSNTVAGDNFMDKDSFFHDQSSPIPSVTASPGGFAYFGNGLESLLTTEGEKTAVEEDLFKSTRVKSLSFGDFDKKASVVNDVDPFKRSVSFGNLFQWTSPTPGPIASKPSGTGSLSGLLSLAGGLPPSQTRIGSSKEDDLFAALSGRAVQTTVRGVDSWLQPAIETVTYSSKPGDDSEDEFSDFVSTGALPSAPSPTSIQQQTAPGQTSESAFDVSFFEAAQPNPSEKRNLDFFGDLMGLNFTNA